jgi:hypothetical protein
MFFIFFLCGAFRCEEPCEPFLVPAWRVHWGIVNLNNSGATAVPAPDSVISRTAFGIRLQCPTEFIPTDTAGVSEPCGFAFMLDTFVTSLRISTRYDLDAGHPAGADVTGLFRVVLSDGKRPFSTPVPNPPVSAHIRYADLQEGIGLLNADNPVVQADFLLIAPPAMPLKVQFIVQIFRSDGSVVLIDSPEVELL